MNDLKVVYIGGYSRSGSTILDILLSQHSAVCGTGELCFLFDDWLNRKRTCSCGRPYAECDFWSDLASTIDIATVSAVIREVEHRSNFKNVVDDRLPAELKSQYKANQEAIFRYIQKKSGKNIIIDSSKTTRDSAGRCLAIAKYTDLDTCMIHLARNGRSTTHSFLQKGSNWALEGHTENSFLQGLRSIVGWRLANEIANKSRTQLAPMYQLLKYEYLIADPCNSLLELGTFLNIAVDSLISKVENQAILQAKHQVGGNRLRRQKDLHFRADIIQSRQLDFFHSSSFEIIAGKVFKELGYAHTPSM